MQRHGWAWSLVLCLVLSASLLADTLILRDGRRIQGQVIGMRDGVIEMEVQRGLFGRDRARFDQADVARIDFDDARTRPGSGFDNGGSGSGGNYGSNAAPERPSGLRERSISVAAAEAWTDTGVSVRPGQTVYFAASGRVRWGPSRQDGPGGERNSPRNDGRPMPNRPGASLIGRVGDSDDYFFVGDETGPVRMRAGGRLYLGVNDDFRQDNSGAFRVTVYY